eukprot:3427012-Pyramimonas_sp.AAC.1
MLQRGDRRPECVETGEAQLRRRLHLLRALLWGEILEFAVAAGAGKHYWGTVGYMVGHTEQTRVGRKLLRQRRDAREKF